MDPLDVYKKSFDNSPNSMLLISYHDNQASITDVNPSFSDFYGYSKQEVLGQTPRIIKSGKQNLQYYNSMWTSILNPSIGYWRDEIINLKKDGTLINVLLTVYSIFDDSGKPNWFIANHIDITKRVQAEQKVEELNEILKLLNKILRHDVLNDLTVVQGNIKLYESGVDKEALADTLPAIKRSLDLITQMRELESAVTSGKQLEKIAVQEVINQAKETFTDMEISISGQAEVLADAAFKSVIANIIRNAKMHGQTNTMDIAINNLESAVEIRLADNGRGIPDEVKPKLFAEGFKYGDTGHTGLGLYIVKRTIERYGGTVSVEDNHPQGTVFVIKLPPITA